MFVHLYKGVMRQKTNIGRKSKHELTTKTKKFKILTIITIKEKTIRLSVFSTNCCYHVFSLQTRLVPTMKFVY